MQFAVSVQIGTNQNINTYCTATCSCRRNNKKMSALQNFCYEWLDKRRCFISIAFQLLLLEHVIKRVHSKPEGLEIKRYTSSSGLCL
jgi:hypothetical protein